MYALFGLHIFVQLIWRMISLLCVHIDMCAYVWNLLKVGGSWHASSCVEEVEEDVELERLSEDDGGVIVQVVLEFKTERS